MASTNGTITLSAKTLPAPCDSVYLLTDSSGVPAPATRATSIKDDTRNRCRLVRRVEL